MNTTHTWVKILDVLELEELEIPQFLKKIRFCSWRLMLERNLSFVCEVIMNEMAKIEYHWVYIQVGGK